MSNDQGSRVESLSRRDFVVRKERLYGAVLAACAVITIAVTVGIVAALSGEALTFFEEISPVRFFTGQEFTPLSNTPKWGVLPLISGTLIVAVGSAVVALPVGLGAAIYLSEYASNRVRSVLKPTLEILAGIPTVVYGYFALVYLTPLLDAPLPISQTILPAGLPVLPEFTLVIPSLRAFNALSASIAVGVMIIPMVSSISEDALSSVPDELRNGGYALGATKFEVSTSIVVPAAVSGIISSYVLALSRAIGETMIVVMAAGQSPKMPFYPNILQNFSQSIETMTAAMVKIASAESLGESVAYESLFAIGLTLFAITLVMNLLADLIRKRYREEY